MGQQQIKSDDRDTGYSKRPTYTNPTQTNQPNQNIYQPGRGYEFIPNPNPQPQIRDEYKRADTVSVPKQINPRFKAGKTHHIHISVHSQRLKERFLGSCYRGEVP